MPEGTLAKSNERIINIFDHIFSALKEKQY